MTQALIARSLPDYAVSRSSVFIDVYAKIGKHSVTVFSLRVVDIFGLNYEDAGASTAAFQRWSVGMMKK
jgi:hypothetical protein